MMTITPITATATTPQRREAAVAMLAVHGEAARRLGRAGLSLHAAAERAGLHWHEINDVLLHGRLSETARPCETCTLFDLAATPLICEACGTFAGCQHDRNVVSA